MSDKKIAVDQDTCIGCTTCAAMCPKYFEMGETGKARPVFDTVTDKSDLDSVVEAEQACPVDAISVKEK